MTVQDLTEFDRLKADPAYRRVLESLLHQEPNSVEDVSESVLLNAVFRVGLQAVREAAQEAGYAELASQRQREQRKANRRTPAWADEP